MQSFRDLFEGEWSGGVMFEELGLKLDRGLVKKIYNDKNINKYIYMININVP